MNVCMVTITKQKILKIVFIDESIEDGEGEDDSSTRVLKPVKEIEVDLKDGKYVDNSHVSIESEEYDDCNIFNLGGINNFLISISSSFESREEVFYYHLNINPVATATSVSVKRINSIDLYLNMDHLDFVAYPLKIGWFIITYFDRLTDQGYNDQGYDDQDYNDQLMTKMSEETESRVTTIVKLDEQGKVIGRDILHLFPSVNTESIVYYHQERFPERFPESTLNNIDSARYQRLHICCQPFGDFQSKDCTCKEKYLSTKILCETGKIDKYKVIDSKTGNEDIKFSSKMELFYKNFKLYSSYYELQGDGKIKEFYSEMTFPLLRSQEQGQGQKLVPAVLERKIEFNYTPPDGKQLMIISFSSHGDYLLASCVERQIDFDRKNDKYVVIKFNFFLKTYQIYRNEYLTQVSEKSFSEESTTFGNYSVGLVMNTSARDFEVSQRLLQVLDPYLPRDLIKLLF